jgi:transposase InsO family protein
MQCKASKSRLSASGFYSLFERPQSLRQQANARLLGRTRDSFVASDRTRDELRADVFDYIERFYAPQEVLLGDNPKRRHSTIGYLSPVQFENLQCA